MRKERILFRILFLMENKRYEIYAESIAEEELLGFLELENIVFDEASHVLVDPSEEKIKTEFENVKRTYIPLHSILRIDEVSKPGIARIVDNDGSSSSTVHVFPDKKKRDIE